MASLTFRDPCAGRVTGREVEGRLREAAGAQILSQQHQVMDQCRRKCLLPRDRGSSGRASVPTLSPEAPACLALFIPPLISPLKMPALSLRVLRSQFSRTCFREKPPALSFCLPKILCPAGDCSPTSVSFLSETDVGCQLTHFPQPSPVCSVPHGHSYPSVQADKEGPVLALWLSR